MGSSGESVGLRHATKMLLHIGANACPYPSFGDKGLLDIKDYLIPQALAMINHMESTSRVISHFVNEVASMAAAEESAFSGRGVFTSVTHGIEASRMITCRS